MKDALNITPKVDGVAIERPSKTIRYCTPINVAAFTEKYGVAPTALRLARYDTQSQQWLPVVTEVLGTGETVQVCADLNHFSIWGQIIDVIKEIRQEVPRNLKVKYAGKKKNQRVRFVWDAPDNAPVTTTYVLEYATKAKKKSKCASLDRSLFKQKEVVGTKFAIKKKRSNKVCVQVSVKDGDPTSRTFRKLR